MSDVGHNAYLEGRILSADPLELVTLLYQGCTDSVREARHCLAKAEIEARGQAISKACAILTELIGSLDYERGGEIAKRLGLLYDYMQRRLLDAHARQADEPLAEVLGLLLTLAEGWAGVQPAAPESNVWAMAGEAVESHAWSC